MVEYHELQQALDEIKRWEQAQEDIRWIDKLGKVPFALLDRVTPDFIHQKFNVIIEELSTYITTGGNYLINKKAILKQFQKIKSITSLADIPSFSIPEMDQICDTIVSSKKTIATAQGATTGFGGVFTLAMDIPAVLGLSMNTLQEIAICYGFDPHEEKERLFIVKCMQFCSSDLIGKQTILQEIAHIDQLGNTLNTASQIQSWREVMYTYRDRYGWKKTFQLVPIVGMIFGSYFNRKTIDEVAEVGKMLYKKRRIQLLLNEKNETDN